MSVISFTSFIFSFGVCVDSKFVMIGFPVHSMEFLNLTFNKYLLVRQLLTFGIGQIEQFNTEWFGLFNLEIVDYC